MVLPVFNKTLAKNNLLKNYYLFRIFIRVFLFSGLKVFGAIEIRTTGATHNIII